MAIDVSALPDQTASLQAAVAVGGTVRLPPGLCRIDGQITLSNIEIIGSGAPNDSLTEPGTSGTTIVLTDPAVSPFILGQSVRLVGLNLACATQDGSQEAPTPWVPLFTDDGSTSVSNIVFEGVNCPNAYDFIGQSGKGSIWGNIDLIGCNVYAIRYPLNLCNVQESFRLTDCLFNPSLFEAVTLRLGHPLLAWTIANGAWLHVFGDGVPGKGDMVPVGGIQAKNLTVVCYRRGVHVETGSLDEALIEGTFDACPTILEVGPSGGVTRAAFDGHYYAFGLTPGVTPTAAFLLANPAPGISGGSDLRISGDLAGGDGDFLVATGASILGLGLSADVLNPGMVMSHPAYGAFIDAPNATVRIANGRFQAANPRPDSVGVALVNARAAVVSGNVFDGFGKAVAIGGISGQAAISGNASSRTQGPRSFDPAGSNVVYSGNAWDRP